MQTMTWRKWAFGSKLSNLAVPIRARIAATRSPPASDLANSRWFGSLPSTRSSMAWSLPICYGASCQQRGAAFGQSHIRSPRPNVREGLEVAMAYWIANARFCPLAAEKHGSAAQPGVRTAAAIATGLFPTDDALFQYQHVYARPRQPSLVHKN